jgi:hypothetical protein
MSTSFLIAIADDAKALQPGKLQLKAERQRSLNEQERA